MKIGNILFYFILPVACLILKYSIQSLLPFICIALEEEEEEADDDEQQRWLPSPLFWPGRRPIFAEKWLIWYEYITGSKLLVPEKNHFAVSSTKLH